MKNGILSLLILASFSLFAQDKMNAFTFVEIDGPIKVELIQSETHGVEILEEDELVSWEINGHSLVVIGQYREGYDTPKIRIHIKELKKLHLFGQVVLESTGTFESRRMNIQLNHQSLASLSIDTEELDTKLTQQSILSLSGNADDFTIEANQQSILKARSLKSVTISAIGNHQSVINIQKEGAKVSSSLRNQSVLN